MSLKLGNFAALGHGIIDIDTGQLISIANGEITKANILNIEKGERGKPGEVRGSLINQKTIGNVSKNTRFGIFGRLTNISELKVGKEKALTVASRDEIRVGQASILCSLNNDETEEYSIEIEKV